MKKQKSMGKFIILLALIQLLRFIFKSAVFLFVPRTLLSDALAGGFFMAASSAALILLAMAKNIPLKLFPKKFSSWYIAASAALLLFMAVTVFMTGLSSAYDYVFFVYTAVLTVVFEEILFRGFIWTEISIFSDEKRAYIISSVLFGLWHLGYMDTVIWRTSLFFPDADIFSIMVSKVITGGAIGLILGYFRYKCKNAFSSALVHSLLNSFGA